ncbi:MAG: hypothetical protein D6730_02460 [Bacteroidetes bacterium]|nr:MAG: hypothetical protein D6730_02460 [Bacteroidota bacterium]
MWLKVKKRRSNRRPLLAAGLLLLGGMAGMLWGVPACSPPVYVHRHATVKADKLLNVHTRQQEQIYCRVQHGRRLVYRLTHHYTTETYLSGRVVENLHTDTLFAGSMSVDVNCPQRLEWQ